MPIPCSAGAPLAVSRTAQPRPAAHLGAQRALLGIMTNAPQGRTASLTTATAAVAKATRVGAGAAAASALTLMANAILTTTTAVNPMAATEAASAQIWTRSSST